MVIILCMRVVTSIINVSYFIIQVNDYIITSQLLIILMGNCII